MGQKYKVLRFIAMAMKALGFIVAVLTVLSALGICGTGVLGGATLDRFGREFGQNTTGLGFLTGLVGGLIAMILPIVLGGSLAMFLFAGGEAINLQIDIEENTRTMAWFLQRQPWTLTHAPTGLSPQTANLTAPSPTALPLKDTSLPEYNLPLSIATPKQPPHLSLIAPNAVQKSQHRTATARSAITHLIVQH